MNPDDLVKGELYQVGAPDREWHDEITLYLGSYRGFDRHGRGTIYQFLVKGQQRDVNSHFLKYIKELK
tara:strand:- start:495 stop:698 length:204 start_codon:yes stop_codon:yes gene_type:complete